MPYIITPGIQTTDSGTNFDSTAVATIDEAREYAASEMEDRRPPILAAFKLHEQCAKLPETGGTIGPLPDGHVIDVQPLGWIELGNLAGFNWMSPREDIAEMRADEIIDAYNVN